MTSNDKPLGFWKGLYAFFGNIGYAAVKTSEMLADSTEAGHHIIKSASELVDVAHDNAKAYRQQSLVESAISLEHTKQRLTATLAADTSMDDAAKDAIADQLAKLTTISLP